MSSATGNNRPYNGVTVLSFIIAVTLFILIVIHVFTKPAPPPAAKSAPALITTTTSIKIDSSIKTTGKKVIIDTTIVTKPAESVAAAPTSDDSINKKLTAVYNYFLLLFGVFIILAILPRLKSFNFSKDGVSADFQEIAKALNEAQSQMAQTPQMPQGGRTATEEMKHLFIEEKIRMVNETSALDPQKGRWGGKAENNNRKLSAVISRMTGSDWAEIILRVESTDPKKDPLKGIVTFHLHPTFINSSPVIIVLNGIAEIKTKAWGAFTVGAVADNGKTTLELDLQGLPGSYEPFNSR